MEIPYSSTPHLDFSGSDGEYNGPADITFEDMRRTFTHLNQYVYQDDTYWFLNTGSWDWYGNKPDSDHTYRNSSGKIICLETLVGNA